MTVVNSILTGYEDNSEVTFLADHYSVKERNQLSL